MPKLPIPTIDRTRKHAAIARVARYGTVGLLLCSFIATHYPADQLPHEVAQADKLLHFVAYLSLAYAALVSWDLAIGPLRPAHYFTVWLVGTLYGAFDEITQIPVGRHGDIHDWLYDVMGVVFALILFRVTRPALSRLLGILKPEVAVN